MSSKTPAEGELDTTCPARHRAITDPVLVDFSGGPGSVRHALLPRLNVTWGTDGLLSTGSVVERFHTAFPDHAADLLEIAAAAHVADRLVARARTRDDPFTQRWARRMRLRVPVRAVDAWRASAVSTGLEQVLAWLTADHWTFEFVPTGQASDSAISTPLRDNRRFLFSTLPDAPSFVALCSGGLDSTAGLATALSAEPGATAVPSAWP